MEFAGDSFRLKRFNLTWRAGPLRALQELHSAGRKTRSRMQQGWHFFTCSKRKPGAHRHCWRHAVAGGHNTLLERYLPETLEKETYEVTWKVSFSGLCL